MRTVARCARARCTSHREPSIRFGRATQVRLARIFLLRDRGRRPTTVAARSSGVIDAARASPRQTAPALASTSFAISGVSTCVCVSRFVATIGLPGSQVRIDLERRVGAADARRHQQIGGLHEARNLFRRLLAGEHHHRRCARRLRARACARSRPARGSPPTTRTRSVGPRLRRRSPRRRSTCPRPDTPRTCRCRAPAARRRECPRRLRTSAGERLGGSSTSPPMTFSINSDRSATPIPARCPAVPGRS